MEEAPDQESVVEEVVLDLALVEEQGELDLVQAVEEAAPDRAREAVEEALAQAPVAAAELDQVDQAQAVEAALGPCPCPTDLHALDRVDLCLGLREQQLGRRYCQPPWHQLR